MNIIDLRDVKFKYPSTAADVVSIPSFTIAKGEKVFLFGPSGSGKTTFLELLAGILNPQSGSISILEKDLVKATAAERDRFRAANLGYVFQSFNLIPYLSVEENIALPIHLSPERKAKLEGQSVADEIKNLCSSLGIGEFRTRRVTDLSVGQQQRVAVARALLGHPGLILADEPTSSLDYDHREKFIRLLFDVCERNGTTVLFVSHDRSLEKLFSRSVAFQEINQSNNGDQQAGGR